MSIESDRKSDIYENLLKDNFSPNNQYRNSLGYPMGQMVDQGRHSLDQERDINHTCYCYAECQGKQCPCFSALNEMCVKGSCCDICIQMKNSLLLAERGLFCNCKQTQCLKSYCKCFQMNGVCTSLCKCEDCHNKLESPLRALAMQQNKEGMEQGERKYCTCKKTKCNKRYCSCYSSGIKCTNLCQCQGCMNCDYNRNTIKAEVKQEFIEEEDLMQKQFPQKMSFQKINFDHY